MSGFFVDRSAVLSSCGVYRYLLTRGVMQEKNLLYVMLNPSTADSEDDDNTVRRCVSLGRNVGYDHIRVVNLFALRSTDPGALKKHNDPVGPDNDAVIVKYAKEATRIVLAWGTTGRLYNRDRDVVSLIKDNGCADKVLCFGKTKDGSPRHPLFLSGKAKLINYGE